MSSPEPSVRVDARTEAREAAVALEAVATLTWAVPLVFCAAYGIAWFFSLKNLLLLTGHFMVLGSVSLLAEAAARLGRRPGLAGAAQATQALALTSAIVLLYAFYPLIRMFLESEEAFLPAIESANPAMRLAVTMTVAFGLAACALVAFARLLAQAAATFEQKLSQLPLVIVAVFLSAALAAALHGAFAAKEELRDVRHILAGALVGLSILSYTRLYPAIQRVAQCLQREAARDT